MSKSQVSLSWQRRSWLVRGLCSAGVLTLLAPLSACSADIGDPDDREFDESLGTSNLAVMTDEPGHKITGRAGVVRIRLPVRPDGKRSMCTGWLLNETTVVTAAHCLENSEGPNVLGFRIEYMRPGVGADPILTEGTPVQAKASPFYEGGFEVGDFFSNPLNPGEADAKHDIAFIKSSTPWPNTTHTDYLRVYNDDLRTLTSVYVYGTGNIFRTVQATDPDDKLRFSHFNLEPGPFSSDLVIVTEAGQTERLCSGDSGGPYIKEIDGLSLVAGVHHGTDRSKSEFCPKPGGAQWGEKLTWSGSDDFQWLRSFGVSCQFYAPPGNGNNYARCFSLPLISDVPAAEQKYGTKGKAVAIASAILL
jgi:Trypsin